MITNNNIVPPPKKILISDDDQDDQFIFKTAIKEIDPHVEILFFLTSQQMMQYLLKTGIQDENNRLPDVIIGDLKPPFFDLKDITEIRTFKQFRKIPLYIFAESYSEGSRDAALQLGAKGFFHKPNSLHRLKEIFTTVLTPQNNDRTTNDKESTLKSEKKDSDADFVTSK